MSWATAHRLTVLFILGLLAVACLAIFSISIFYRTPTCTDNTQNQDETGVDCGGPCPYLCTAEQYPPVVLFSKALPSGNGRVDLVALVKNVNASAATKEASFEVAIHGTDRIMLGTSSGAIELPPGATVPVYIPNLSVGNQSAARAFLTVATSSIRWYALSEDPRVMPVVSNTKLGGASTTPRIDAVLTNETIEPLSDVRTVVFVFDADGNVIGASQTVLPVIPAQGNALATFTWNVAFPGVPATIEVLPIIPLP